MRSLSPVCAALHSARARVIHLARSNSNDYDRISDGCEFVQCDFMAERIRCGGGGAADAATAVAAVAAVMVFQFSSHILLFLLRCASFCLCRPTP